MEQLYHYDSAFRALFVRANEDGVWVGEVIECFSLPIATVVDGSTLNI